MIIDTENISKVPEKKLSDDELLNYRILCEIENNFKNIFNKNYNEQERQHEILNTLFLLTRCSNDSYPFSNKAVPQFYSKLLAQYLYVICCKDKRCNLQKFSENLKGIKRKAVNNTGMDAFGASLTTKKGESLNEDDHWLLGQVQKDILNNFGTHKLPKVLEWLHDLNLTKIDTHTFGAELKKKRIEEINKALNNSKKKIGRIIFEQFAQKSFLDLDKFKINMLLGVKSFQLKLKLILNIVLEMNDEKLLTEFFNHYGNDTFRYYFNSKIDKNILFIFLLTNKQYELAYKVIERAKMLSIFFEPRTCAEALMYAAEINTFFGRQDVKEEKSPVKSLAFAKPKSFNDCRDAWKGTESQSSYRKSFEDEHLSRTYLTFRKDFNFTEADQAFDDFLLMEKEFFDIGYPFVIEVIRESADEKTLRIHLFRHNIEKKDTDLACDYDCYQVLGKLRQKLSAIFPNDSSWIFHDHTKCDLKYNALINGATLNVTGSFDEIDELIRIISHPSFQMKNGLDLTLADIFPYRKQFDSEDVYLAKVREKTASFVKSGVVSDKDCCSGVFGITREQAHSLLSKKLSMIDGTILTGAKEALIDEAFISYLTDEAFISYIDEFIKEKNIPSIDLLSAFKAYQVASVKDAPPSDLIMNELFKFASNPVVLQAFLDFELLKKNDLHVSIIQALAKTLETKLYLWVIDKDNELSLHPKYPENYVQFPTRRIDLLVVNNNQFVKLELVPGELIRKSKSENNAELSRQSSQLSIVEEKESVSHKSLSM